MRFILAVLAIIFSVCTAEVYLSENFGAGWKDRWVQAKKEGLGVFEEASTGGIKTSQDAKFYDLSTKFGKVFNTDGKDLVLQFNLNYKQDIDCGGGYIKFLYEGLNQENFDGSSEYGIMFGPDVCGSTKKVHLILNYNGKNVDWKKTNNVGALSDTNAHVYTAIIKSDGSYEVLIDGEKKESGTLLEDWPLLAPKTIDDPSAKKPADWVDEKEIVDPNDKKPEDWDVPKTIADPNAKKPDDWDEEEDGKWEPPQVTNPEYRGEYSPKMIPNPAYKGEWKPNQIPNPDFKEDPSIGKYKLAFAGIDVWQVKSGTIFNNILVTDSVEEAKKARDEILEKNKQDKAVAEEEKKAEEAKKAAEAEKAKEAAKDFEKEKSSEDELTKLAKEKAEQLKQEAGSDDDKKDEL
eukprot:gene1802-944_t